MGKLSIRDESVNDLADELVSLMAAGTTKTEAVRAALVGEIARIRSAETVDDKISAIQRDAAQAGILRRT